MVALPGHTHQYPDSIMKDEKKLAEAIDEFLMSEREAFKRPGVHLGGWVSDGKLWLDPSENITDRAEAIGAGKSRDQLAIWDVAGGQEIDTAGTGGVVTEHSAQGVSERPPWLRRYASSRAEGRGSAAGAGIAQQAAGIDLAGDWRRELRDLLNAPPNQRAHELQVPSRLPGGIMPPETISAQMRTGG